MTTKRIAIPALAGCLALLAAGCSSGFDEDGDTSQDKGGKQHLSVLIASSGDPETNAVKAAAAAWAKRTGNTVTVEAAKDMNQQLGQAFAGGNPPDVFYVDSGQFANYFEGGSLYSYGSQVENAADLKSSLTEPFTRDGKLVCAPKDGADLALVVNTELWQAAGLTEKDHPTTWDDLETVAGKLTQGKVTGLVTTEEYQRLGVFLKQAGGWVTNPAQTRMTADTPENLQGLEFVQEMLQSGSLKYAKDVDARWAGEAFGEGQAAMTIEGNWLAGAMKTDYPDVDYKVLPLPQGPKAKGTLAFTNCWGVAQKSRHRAAAVSLVNHLLAPEQQLTMGNAFGAIPSRTSATQEYLKQHPDFTAWGLNGDFVQGPVTAKGMDKVMAQFNTELLALKTTDPKKILQNLQRNGAPVLQKNAQ